jgi:hypothetical protein
MSNTYLSLSKHMYLGSRGLVRTFMCAGNELEISSTKPKKIIKFLKQEVAKGQARKKNRSLLYLYPADLKLINIFHLWSFALSPTPSDRVIVAYTEIKRGF